MARDLTIKFVNDGSNIKEISHDKKYYITEVDQVKEKIDLAIINSNKETIIKNYELYISGEKQLSGKIMFGNKESFSFAELVKKTIDKVPGDSNEKSKFLSLFNKVHDKEDQLFRDDIKRKFTLNLSNELPNHEFTLNQVEELFDSVKIHFRSITELDRSYSYIKECYKISIDKNTKEEFSIFNKIVKVYHGSISHKEYDFFNKKIQIYKDYEALLSSPIINFMEGIKRVKKLKKDTMNAIIEEMVNGVIIKNLTEYEIIAKPIVERLIIDHYEETNSKTLKMKLETIIGYPLEKLEIVEIEESFLNRKEDNKISKGKFEWGDFMTTTETKDEKKTSDKTMETIMRLYQEGKIKNILELSDEEKILINEEMSDKKEKYSYEELVKLYENLKLEVSLIEFFHGEKSNYDLAEERMILSNIEQGDCKIIFENDDDSEGIKTAFYEKFKVNIGIYLFNYENESEVNNILRKSMLELSDLYIFKEYAAEKYATHVSSLILKALKKASY